MSLLTLLARFSPCCQQRTLLHPLRVSVLQMMIAIGSIVAIIIIIIIGKFDGACKFSISVVVSADFFSSFVSHHVKCKILEENISEEILTHLNWGVKRFFQKKMLILHLFYSCICCERFRSRAHQTFFLEDTVAVSLLCSCFVIFTLI